MSLNERQRLQSHSGIEVEARTPKGQLQLSRCYVVGQLSRMTNFPSKPMYLRLISSALLLISGLQVLVCYSPLKFHWPFALLVELWPYWSVIPILSFIGVVAITQLRRQKVRVSLGDFNATPWSPHFQRFERLSQLQNAGHRQWIWATWYFFQTSAIRYRYVKIPIDHIETRGYNVLKTWTGQPSGSDHKPIITVLEPT